MTHPLARLVQVGDYRQIDQYFEKQNTLSSEEQSILLSGLSSANWRIRHRCARNLRWGTLTQTECDQLVKKLNDPESMVVEVTLLSLFHQPLMLDFIDNWLHRHKKQILYHRFPEAFFIEKLYKNAAQSALRNPEPQSHGFLDFTEEVLRTGISSEKEIFGFASVIAYTGVMADNRPSIIDLLLLIAENESHSDTWRQTAINSLCAIKLPSDTYLQKVYDLVCRFRFWITLPRILHFARQYSFTNQSKIPFIVSILERFAQISTEDYFALIDLRELLQITPEIVNIHPRIAELSKNDGPYCFNVYKVLVLGQNPLKFQSFTTEKLMDCEIVTVQENAEIFTQFLLTTTQILNYNLHQLPFLEDSMLKKIRKGADIYIHSNSKKQEIHVHQAYGWETDFHYSKTDCDLAFYRGDDRDSTRIYSFEDYLTVARRQMASEGFSLSASTVILNLFEGTFTGNVMKAIDNWKWVEDTLAPHYENIAMTSSFAHLILAIHQKTQSDIPLRGTLTKFLDSQTMQETLVFKLLVDFAQYSEEHPHLNPEFEEFFADILESKPCHNAHRTFGYFLHTIKDESEQAYHFWLQWFGQRCQNVDVLHQIAVFYSPSILSAQS